MGILSKSTGQAVVETPESLRDELIAARSEQDAAIAEAINIYAGAKESVVQRASVRVQAVGGLIDELTAEKEALDAILADGGAEPELLAVFSTDAESEVIA